MIDFTGKTILVTGASSGIGKAISVIVNKWGGNVVAVGRNQLRLNELCNEASNPNNIYLEIKDFLEDLENIHKWCFNLAKKYNEIDGLVLSAGIRKTLPLKSISYKKSLEIFNLNYFTNILLIKGFIKSNIFNKEKASIVLISSLAALTGGAGVIDYAASKAALLSATKSIAAEVYKKKIRVNSVSPGYVKTNLIEDDKYLDISNIWENYPLGSGLPDDIAGAVCFLLSELSLWITGTNIVIDGGRNIIN